VRNPFITTLVQLQAIPYFHVALHELVATKGPLEPSYLRQESDGKHMLVFIQWIKGCIVCPPDNWKF